MLHLVEQFVRRLFEDEEFDEAVQRRRGLHQRRALPDGGTVAGEEGRRRFAFPAAHQRAEAVAVGRPLGGGAVGRHGGDVAEAAQHARHVAQRTVLAASLGERTVRVALEVGDDEVVLRQQHLAEVVVAVVARLESRDARQTLRSETVEQRLALGQQAVDAGAQLVARRLPESLERIERAHRELARLQAPEVEIDGRERFGSEGRIVGFPAEGEVQLAGAPAKDLHEGEEEAVRAVGGRQDAAVRIGEALGEETVYIIEGIVPADVLMFDIGLQQREGVGFAVGAVQLDRAGDRHDPVEAGRFGQVAANLDLEVGAGQHAAIALEEEPVVEIHRGVALLKRGMAHGHVDPIGQFRVARAGAEGDHPLAGAAERQVEVRADAAHQRPAETLVAEGAVEDAHARLLAHPGQRPGCERRELLVIRLVLPADRQRQEVALGLAVGEAHLDDGEEPAAVRRVQLAFLDESETGDRPVTAHEPALGGEIGADHLVLQLLGGGGGDGAADDAGVGRAAGQRHPAFGEDEHRQFGA